MTRLGQWRLSDGYSLRLGAFYAAVFLVVGVQLPFWPVWLAGHGFDPQEIAAIFAATIWAKVVATPAIGALADRTGQRRLVMASLAAIAWIGYAMLWPITGFWPVLALNLVAAVAQSAVMPLGDAVTLAGVAALADVAPATLGGNAVLLCLPPRRCCWPPAWPFRRPIGREPRLAHAGRPWAGSSGIAGSGFWW